MPTTSPRSRCSGRWSEAWTARAAGYWTADRVAALLGEQQLILEPVQAAPLLRAMGILKRDASMTPATTRKFMQINHMVRLLRPFLLELARDRGRVRLLDAGCGSSYLTLLLGWCFKHIWREPAWILGIDRNSQIVGKCARRARLVELEDVLRFAPSAIGDFDLSGLTAAEQPPGSGLDALVALHACDTATDEALALGIRLEVRFLAVAPCCHVELSQKLARPEVSAAGALSPLWRTPHLRREAAASFTDMMRTLLLRGCGYRVTPMEFVPSQHTPKNTMLRAVRDGDGDPAALGEYRQLREALGGAGIRLEELLPAPQRRTLS